MASGTGSGNGYYPHNYPPEAFDTFFSRGSVRATWIAFFIMFLIWAFLWMLSMLSTLIHGSQPSTDGASANAGDTENPTTAERNYKFKGSSVKRAFDVSRDLLLGLLAALTINSLGRGSSVAVL
ncbi:10253_t:CDS:2, partial [Ambispora leptoticha]